VSRLLERKLLWKSRRGLLELDLVLTRYLQQTPYDEELDALLDLGDNDLWDIVSGRSESYDARFGAVVARLRAV
jgi:succinate dehydrogenase flavin-adding protein (antitoxin of CptAB toxin-antitoxin module)